MPKEKSTNALSPIDTVLFKEDEIAQMKRWLETNISYETRDYLDKKRGLFTDRFGQFQDDIFHISSNAEHYEVEEYRTQWKGIYNIPANSSPYYLGLDKSLSDQNNDNRRIDFLLGTLGNGADVFKIIVKNEASYLYQNQHGCFFNVKTTITDLEQDPEEDYSDGDLTEEKKDMVNSHIEAQYKVVRSNSTFLIDDAILTSDE